jgi:hypothetical protein
MIFVCIEEGTRASGWGRDRKQLDEDTRIGEKENSNH